jgi:hypothetical protein
MATTHALPARARSGSGPLAVLVALLTLALLSAGLWSGFRQIFPTTAERLHIQTVTGPGPFAVGQSIRTAIGVVTVTGVERLKGTSSQDLAGANHGIQNYVSEEKSQVQVFVRVADDTVRPITWSPSAFTLRVGSAAAIAPQSSTMPGGRLGAGTSVEGTLGFVAARNGSALTLQLPGSSGGWVLVDLGRVDAASTSTGGDHGH